MHLLDKTNKVGRLLSLVRREKPDSNFSFFSPVEGLEQVAILRKVTDGIQKTAKDHEKEYEFRTFSVADFGRVKEDFHKVDETQIWLMRLESWLDENGQFDIDLARQVVKWRINNSTDDLPDLITGGLSKGKDFFNQQDIIDQIWALIQDGKSLLLAAPRRFGKSSLINQLNENPPKGVMSCSVDLEKGASAPDFIRLISSGLLDSNECRKCLPQDVFEKLAPNATERQKLEIVRSQRENIEQDWQAFGHTLFGKMNKTGKRFLLILDEFSWMLEDMITANRSDYRGVKTFLEWFLAVCNQYKNVSVIITGSEHISSYLEAYKLPSDFIDHLQKINLRTFEKNTTCLFSFLALFNRGIAVSPVDLQTIWKLMEHPIPYFLQVFLDLLQNECHKTGHIAPDDFKDIYFEKLLGRDAKRYFEYVDHQIERYARYGLQTDSVKKILNALGQKDKIETKELSAMWDSFGGGKPFWFILALLKNDFFLVEHNDYVSMECKIFRDYFNLQITNTI